MTPAEFKFKTDLAFEVYKIKYGTYPNDLSTDQATLEALRGQPGFTEVVNNCSNSYRGVPVGYVGGHTDWIRLRTETTNNYIHIMEI